MALNAHLRNLKTPEIGDLKTESQLLSLKTVSMKLSKGEKTRRRQ